VPRSVPRLRAIVVCGYLITFGTLWQMGRSRWVGLRRRALWAAVPGVVAGVGARAALADDKKGWTIVSAAVAAMVGAFGPTVADRVTADRGRRQRISAFQSSTVPVPSPGPQVDPEVLTVIASACRDHQRVQFEYRAHSGTASRRSVEPYRLVNHRHRWYLVAWDLDRDAWRTFRVDRITPRAPAGPRFTPRPLPPDGEIAAQIARGVGEATWRYRARVIVHAPATYVRGRLPIPLDVQPLTDDRCMFEPGSDHPEMLALYLGMLDADFTIVDSPELVDALRKLTRRYQRAIDASQLETD
jgi:predicted DNA-binding transcriptional regulator YafY